MDLLNHFDHVHGSVHLGNEFSQPQGNISAKYYDRSVTQQQNEKARQRREEYHC